MDDTSKYLIHADITADGVVERSDVVGAIFGQTEGLLGDELDLRDLQQSSKVGRIDVEIDSEAGQSHGTVTIASSLDKVETAILAASLETISRVGPCHATVDISRIEDVRAAKRRAVVDRAKELLSASFDESVMTSREILEEVRESVRVEDITEYEGLPAGPRVETSDAIVVVEGRADVLNLLRYGIKNAIAVEGTNVPDAVADLTQERNVTAFLDGDRGGELILRELAQVGHVDYVAFAPEGRSVEDLARQEVMSALRNKVDYDTLADESDIQSAVAATDGSAQPAPDADEHAGPESPSPETDVPDGPSHSSEDDVHSDDASDAPPTTDASAARDAVSDVSEPTDESDPAPAEPVGVTDEGPTIEHVETLDDAPSEDGEDDVDADTRDDVLDDADADREPKTLRGHVQAVIDAGTGQVRLLDSSFDALTDAPAADAFDAVNDAESVPFAVVLDDELSQRVLDVAAQRGVEHVVARATGEFVKKPIGVRVRTAEELAAG